MDDDVISLAAAHAFFQQFCADFATFDGQRIAARYATPCIALGADVRLQQYADADALAAAFQSYLDTYHAQGCRHCCYEALHLLPTGTQSAVVTVSWRLLSAAGEQVLGWRESYGLMRTAEGLRVYFSADHRE